MTRQHCPQRLVILVFFVFFFLRQGDESGGSGQPGGKREGSLHARHVHWAYQQNWLVSSFFRAMIYIRGVKRTTFALVVTSSSFSARPAEIGTAERSRHAVVVSYRGQTCSNALNAERRPCCCNGRQLGSPPFLTWNPPPHTARVYLLKNFVDTGNVPPSAQQRALTM